MEEVEEDFASKWDDPEEMVLANLDATPVANFGKSRGPEPIPLAVTPQNFAALCQNGVVVEENLTKN